MRYFIARKNGAVTEKRAYAGDSQRIDAIISDFTAKFPNLVITEVDQPTFDSTPMAVIPTADQVAWAAFKATGPSAAQAITYLAKQLGLE